MDFFTTQPMKTYLTEHVTLELGHFPGEEFQRRKIICHQDTKLITLEPILCISLFIALVSCTHVKVQSCKHWMNTTLPLAQICYSTTTIRFKMNTRGWSNSLWVQQTTCNPNTETCRQYTCQVFHFCKNTYKKWWCRFKR